MYAAVFALLVAFLFMSANWLMVPPCAAAMVVIGLRIGKEETMMMERFGDDYRAYTERTGRLLPRLRFKRDLTKRQHQR